MTLQSTRRSRQTEVVMLEDDLTLVKNQAAQPGMATPCSPAYETATQGA